MAEVEKYQVYGQLILYNGTVTDHLPPGASQAAKQKQLDDQKKKDAADAKYKADEAKARADERLKAADEDVERAKQEAEAAKQTLEKAEAAAKQARDALNKTLASARHWLQGTEVAVIAGKVVLVMEGIGVVEEFGAGVAEGYLGEGEEAAEAIEKAHKIIKGTATVLDRASQAKDAKEALEVLNAEHFEGIDEYMPSEEISKLGAEVDHFADQGGSKGAQVIAEGRTKFREQFKAAADAKRKEEEARDDAAAKEADKDMAAIHAQAVHGVLVKQ